MLFSWLADKITVAVSKITSNSSGEGRCLDWFILQSLSSFFLGVEVSPRVGYVYGPLTAMAPALGSVLDKAIQERG